MNISRNLDSNFPKTINREGEIYQALITNPQNDSVLETILGNAEKYAKNAQEKNLYNFDGEDLTYAAYYFADKGMISPYPQNTKARMQNLFIRNHRTKWGTPYDIRNTLEEFLLGSTVYVLEHADDETLDLIKNGEFEEITGTNKIDDWSYNGTFGKDIEINTNYYFYGIRSIGIKQSGLYQVIENLTSGIYFLHFFYIGGVNINIEYLKNGTYTQITAENHINGNGIDFNIPWEHVKIQFKLPADSPVRITFKSTNQDCFVYVDSIRMYKYLDYPMFNILAVYEGKREHKPLAIINEKGDFDKTFGAFEQGFYEGDRFTSTAEYIKYLIDYLRPVGVKASFEAKTRIVDESEWAYVDGSTLVLPYGNIAENELNVPKEIGDKTLKA